MTNDPSKADNGNRVELVFCAENVDPELISRLLILPLSDSYKAGDKLTFGNMNGRKSPVGMWKMSLPDATPSLPVEAQIEQWLALLTPKAAAIGELRQRGYRPYLDCKAESGSLSLCVEPEILDGLGSLGLALSVWLFEQPTKLD